MERWILSSGRSTGSDAAASPVLGGFASLLVMNATTVFLYSFGYRFGSILGSSLPNKAEGRLSVQLASTDAASSNATPAVANARVIACPPTSVWPVAPLWRRHGALQTRHSQDSKG